MSRAKRKKSRRRPIIGYLTPWIYGPIGHTLWEAIDDMARQHDANLVCFPGGYLHSSDQPVGLYSAVYDLITEKDIDGLILRSDTLATHVSPEEFEDFCRKYRALPMVSISRTLEGIPSVQVDNEQGMYDAVTHLIESHGLGRIAFIRGTEGSQEAEGRYRGYTRALAEHELSLDPDLVVPGDFTLTRGVEAIDVLLGQRKLSPGKSFDAIAAANDNMALGAVEALHARGVRVPGDIPIVGFDNTGAAKYASQPLTTVHNPLYEAGQQATELLLAQMEGRDVPESVLLPCDLIIRQSCGCPLPLVARAAVSPAISVSTEKTTTALSPQRKSILPDLLQAIEGSFRGVNPEWAEWLLDAFIDEMEKASEGAFLTALGRVLDHSEVSGLDVFLWQDALSALRRCVLPYLSHDDATRAEDVLGQARVLVGEMAQRIQGRQVALLTTQARLFSDIEHTLPAKFDMAELLDATVQVMRTIGIPSCCIMAFGEAQTSEEQAKLFLAYDEEENRVDLHPDGHPLSSRRLLLDGLLSPERRRTLVLEPLHLQDGRLWFMLLEVEPLQGDICQALRAQLSSAFEGVLLLRARQETEEALARAYAEVEKQVQERTAELQQEIAERERAEADRERLVRALEQRSRCLQAATEVSHAASSILDPDELIRRAVEVVREWLSLYYAGLFLVDQTDEWAMLQAGTGEAGQQMVEHRYTIQVNEDTNVGWCIANQQARIVSASDGENALAENPLLPETLSELALPLISRGQAIGAMTFQSSDESAFSEEDVAVFQTMADQLANAIVNARLFDRAQRELTNRREIEDALKHRLEQLAALSQASQAMTTFLEPDQVLGEIVSLANDVVDSDYTGVILVDETNNIGQSVENLPGVKALEYRVREDGLTRWIVRHRRAVVIDEIDQDGTVFPSQGEGAPSKANPLIVEAKIKSFAGLPLMVKDRLLGALYLHSLRPNAFGGQLFLLSAFANQVAIAIENARLFQNEQQQTQRLGLLVEVARIAATTLDADALLQAVADSIFRHFDYPRVGLFTLDENGRELILRGRSASTITVEEMAVPGIYRLPIEQGISGYVARTGKSHLAPDVSTDPYFANPTKAPTASALGVPILDADRVMGTVLVESENPAAFDSSDLSLMEAVADSVAVGLRNAWLHQETQRRVEELTLLNRISIGPGIALDLDTMIKDTFENLHGLVKADRISFIAIDIDEGLWKITNSWAASELTSHTGESGSLKDAGVELKSLAAGQPFAISDTTTDLRIKGTLGIYRALQVRSALLTPVQVGGRLHGVLGFTTQDERRVWHPDEIRFSETIANQMALVMENAHLFEETQLRAEELAIALARLEELDHLKDEFIQNVSHELRSPLALVRGYAEMLDAGELGELAPDQQMPVAVIARRARMLSDLVKDITMILEAEVSPPDPEPVPWDELAQNAVEDFQVAAHQAELTIEAEIAPALPPVCGAPTYVRRVLDNLLGNAVKFTPAGGTITVRLYREEEFVALEVSDTGVGIPDDKLTRIFDRFYQVDGSASRRFGGMGLGLALVREIVEAYKGRVMVESQVGEGSTFKALLPVFNEPKKICGEKSSRSLTCE